MEQGSGRSWVFVAVSREVWGLRDGTPANKKKEKRIPSKQEEYPANKKNAFQTRKTPANKGKRLSSKKNTFQAGETPFEQGKRLLSKGYLLIECRSLRVVGVFRQGKAVVSDGG